MIPKAFLPSPSLPDALTALPSPAAPPNEFYPDECVAELFRERFGAEKSEEELRWWGCAPEGSRELGCVPRCWSKRWWSGLLP